MAAGGLFWPSSSPSSLTRSNAMQRTCDHAHENRGNVTRTTICVACSDLTFATRANSIQEGHIGPLVSRITLAHPTLSSPACSYMQNRDRATANAIARASAALALLVESMPNFMSAIGSTAPAGAGQRCCRSGVEDGQGEGDQCGIAPRIRVLYQGSEREISLSAALPWPPATAMLKRSMLVLF